ncbi:hypothetical protein R6Q59_001501 [Mikania micrantha]
MQNLRLFPQGCLINLTRLVIYGCDNIESFPDNGYGFLPSCCLRHLSIFNCQNLKSFPHEHLQSFESLNEIIIHGCPNLDYTFPSGLWPRNLSLLEIGELKKPISEWGKQNFPTSLVKLILIWQRFKSGYICKDRGSRYIIIIFSSSTVSNLPISGWF